MSRTLTAGSLLAASALFAQVAEARPVGPQAFCQAYPTSPSEAEVMSGVLEILAVDKTGSGLPSVTVLRG